MQRCTESFSIWRDGAPLAFVAGQLVDDKHPILKTHSHLFTQPQATVHRAAVLRPVEQATADPGERRDLAPPADPAAGAPFDPAVHTGPEVIEYLKAADEDERARVLAAERDGKNRSTVLGADLSKG
ncbi:hypothetical protein ACFXAZ_36685 [Streptomyces sp. NPDC059477]|uniref:hypothetical protein n=1 Tax=Streptomyces sp. NPDC059477 TaxID=3346847 RepID=UPI0036AAD9DA